MDYGFTRRDFLANLTTVASACLFEGMAGGTHAALIPASFRSAPSAALKRQIGAGSGPPTDARGMIVYSQDYVTRETPASLLDSWITPTEHFFVRNNEYMPQIKLANWKLSITGEVARPLTLTMGDLSKIEPRGVTNTLECAGNGRAFFEPRIRGVPWSRGGVGNAAFRGPSLGFLLRFAGAKNTARHVAFRGAALKSPYPPFMRSIPMDKALDPDTIIAVEMNGAPLTPEHGYPARALVPGWIGSASIKWLTEIRVLAHQLEGFFMDSAYRLPAPGGESTENGAASAKAQRGSVITSLPVKSIITTPADGSTIEGGAAPVRISGAAWAGEATVARVEVSTDGGQSWGTARFGSERARFSWRLWDFEWRPPAEGTYTIFSRATDNRGRSQPFEMKWNPGGYLWNAVDRVELTVGKPA